MNLTTPRLELIAAQRSANLAQNIKNALNNENVRNFYDWSDSTVVLHWLKNKGECKVFVSNRVEENIVTLSEVLSQLETIHQI